MLSQNLLYFGREDAPRPGLRLDVGLLSLVFEPEWASVRHISIAGKEVIRGIYCAVRDQFWNTVKPRLQGLRVTSTNENFEITFDVGCREGEVDFFWKGLVTGDHRGTLCFRMDGEARSSFLRNRLGFCVLHPMETCVGRRCRIDKADGSSESTRFPYSIAPHQPFKDVKAISYEVFPGVTLETRFEGDVFETEDQRNWTDASYKTYCTPLDRPFPVEMNPGDRVSQSVTLRLRESLADVPPAASRVTDVVTVSPVGTPPLPLPRLGLCCSGLSFLESATATRRLQALRLFHLRVDLYLWKEGWEERLRQAASESEVLGVKLELALHVSDRAEEELRALVAQSRALKPAVTSWLIFHKDEKSTSARWIETAWKTLSDYPSRPSLGAGSKVYFTELNRVRPPVGRLDLVCYPVNPQVHAFDDQSLAETLPTQAWTVYTAREFCGDVPLAVSPVTLKPRFNPTIGEIEESPERVPASADVRQVALFGAVWTLGSLKHLCESGVWSVTFFEALGPRGVMERDDGGPPGFPSIPGAVFPLFHVLADAGDYAGARVVPTIAGTRPGVETLLLLGEDRRRLILANTTLATQYVSVCGCGFGRSVRLKRLDQTTAEYAMRKPEDYRKDSGLLLEVKDDTLAVALLPYAVMRIDSAGD